MRMSVARKRFTASRRAQQLLLVLCCTLLLVVTFHSINLARAAEDTSLNLTTSPLPINLVAKPGTNVTTQLRIKNSGNKTEKLKVGLLKFAAFGEEGKPRLLDRQPGDDFFDWVSFSEPSFTAEPNIWHTIDMTIKLPKSAAFGYYYAVTFSRVDAPVPNGEKQAALAGATATLVLVEARVPGAKRQVEVVEFKADHGFYEYLPVSFNIRLKNQGNVHVVPTGNIIINKAKRGEKDIGLIDVNPEHGNILPGSNRIYVADWSDGFPVQILTRDGDKILTDGQGKPQTSLKWDLSQASKLRFGHYTAKLLMIYDDGTRDVPIEALVSFWVIPWRLILVLIAIPTLPAAFTYWMMRRRFRKKLKRPSD